MYFGSAIPSARENPITPGATTCRKSASGWWASSATAATEPPRNTRIDEIWFREQRTATSSRSAEVNRPLTTLCSRLSVKACGIAQPRRSSSARTSRGRSGNADGRNRTVIALARSQSAGAGDCPRAWSAPNVSSNSVQTRNHMSRPLRSNGAAAATRPRPAGGSHGACRVGRVATPKGIRLGCPLEAQPALASAHRSASAATSCGRRLDETIRPANRREWPRPSTA